MKIKLQYIFLALVIIALGFVTFVFIKKALIEETIVDEFELDTDEKYDMYYSGIGSGYNEICYILAKKNGDWSKYPLTDNFKNKYNEKDGILGKVEYDKIEYRPYAGGKYNFYFCDDYNYFVITQGKKQTVYVFFGIFDDNGFIDDVWLSKPAIVFDENGVEQNFDKTRTPVKNNESLAFSQIIFGGNDEKRIGVTPYFYSKYSQFVNIFIHNCPFYRHNSIELVKEKSSWEKQKAYFIVENSLENKERHYIVDYELDDKGWLNDASAKLVGEYLLYEPSECHLGHVTYDCIFYKNSFWADDLDITDNLREKYETKGSVFQDIDMLGDDFDYSDDLYESGTIKKDGIVYQIIRYKFTDGTNHFYDKRIDVTEDGKFDNIEFYELPYVDMTMDEVKKRYENDFDEIHKNDNK